MRVIIVFDLNLGALLEVRTLITFTQVDILITVDCFFNFDIPGLRLLIHSYQLPVSGLR